MKVLTKAIASIGLALFLANASFAQQVKTDYDRAAHFSQYKTFSWKKVQTPDPLWVNRIKAAVDAASHKVSDPSLTSAPFRKEKQ